MTTTEALQLLVPSTTLSSHEQAIGVATKDAAAMHRRELDDPDYGAALRYFLLFSDPARIAAAGITGLDELGAFYNAYYWFKRFAALRADRLGFDAGIEQQAFGLLERAPADVDWSAIEAIDSVAIASPRP
jgi:hypothetical protein